MSPNQPIRTLLLAGILIIAAVVVRSHFENDVPIPPLEVEPSAPVVRVARETPPTIVESNEDWLDLPSDDGTLDGPSPLATLKSLDYPEPPDRPKIYLRRKF